MPCFPEGFLWGAATSAYQIEGGVREGGRGPSIWDAFCAIPGKVSNGQTGDVACDHFHLYKRDVRLMKELGLAAYRFSMAWPRIFPQGSGRPNGRGLDFYDGLIDELLHAGIDPMATLYHWDLPQALQEKGGWGNRDTTDYFAEYAECAFSRFSDRVKKWITHNEPWVTAFAGNYLGTLAPGLTDLSLAVRVSHHLILSHAKAVERFADHKKGGEIGISLNLYPIYPAQEDCEADREAALIADAYHNRWFLDPLFNGEYPKKVLDEFTRALGAPEIKADDMRRIAANRPDFLGVNFYFRRVVEASNAHPILKYGEVIPANSRCTQMGWEIHPESLSILLEDLKNKYGNPRVYITEIGAAFPDKKHAGGMIDDTDRVEFLKTHLEQTSKAISEGADVRGFYVWSLMDNFEWSHGYTKRFGLVRVDYGTQERTLKKSALWYKDLIEKNGS